MKLVPLKFNSFIILILSISITVYSQTSIDSLNKIVDNGVAKYNSGNYIDAEDLFIKAAEIAVRVNEQDIAVRVYNNLGNVYSQLGHSEKSLSYYQKSITISEKIGNKKIYAKALSGIGALYSEQKDFKNSLHYNLLAEQKAIEVNDTLLIGDCKNNRALIYEQLDSLTIASELYSSALETYIMANNIERIALCYNNLGIVEKKLKNYDKALSNYLLAYNMAQKLQNKYFESAMLNNISNIYSRQGKTNKAIEFGKSALGIAYNTKDLELISECLSSLSEHYENIGDYITASQYYKKYLIVHDSFINVSRAAALAEMQIKFDTEKKENEILKLNAENDKKQIDIERKSNLVFIISLISSSVIISFLFLFGYISARNKQKILQEKITAELNERIRIAKDMHDELGASISKIAVITGITIQKSNNIELIENLNQISHSAKDLATNMNDLIWYLRPATVTYNTFLAKIREFSGVFFESSSVNFSYTANELHPDIEINKETERNLFLIIKEALNNILKHSNATQASLTIAKNNDYFNIVISDNGCGFAPDILNTGRNGILNMKSRAEKTGSKYKIESNNITGGTVIEINVPAEKLIST
jgi:two-component system, NarL family, sensor histidine kinase UhpB